MFKLCNKHKKGNLSGNSTTLVKAAISAEMFCLIQVKHLIIELNLMYLCLIHREKKNLLRILKSAVPGVCWSLALVSLLGKCLQRSHFKLSI